MSRERVLAILRGHTAAQISFTIRANAGTIHVNQSTFRRVATAIENGTVNLTIVPQAEMPLRGAGAVYYTCASIANNPDYSNTTAAGTVINPQRPTRSARIPANSLFTQPIHGRVQEALLIHESVHASLDLTSSGGYLSSFQEAAAYIAEILYCRRRGLASAYIVGEQIRAAALPVVNSIIQTRHADDAALTNLVNTISNHRLYRDHARVCYLNNG